MNPNRPQHLRSVPIIKGDISNQSKCHPHQKVVALIKNEIRPGQGSPSPESKSSKSANNHNSNKQHSSGQVDRAAQLYDGLNQLLDDTRFQHMIREVGVETASVIDRAREQINSSRTIEEKRTAFSIGLMELQMNLATRKKQLVKDPNYNFAMSLVGLRGQGSL